MTGSASANGIGSSGNLLADKRYAYAEALADEGNHAAAADLFRQAIEEVPDWAAAHLARGLSLERTGDRAGALAAFAAAVAHDPTGRLGAALHRDRLDGTAPSAMSHAYVEALFDQYAPRFDTHLVEALGYRGPQVIMAALDGLWPGRDPGAALDLGCGTGLMARALARPGLAIDGVDLSAAMLTQAEATGLYRTLLHGECRAVAEARPPGSYELALAADVLVYLGDLGPLFAAVAQVLAPEGLFAATAQAGIGDGFALGADLRFSHGAGYLRHALAASGFKLLRLDPCATRREHGTDVPGLVFVARRS